MKIKLHFPQRRRLFSRASSDDASRTEAVMGEDDEEVLETLRAVRSRVSQLNAMATASNRASRGAASSSQEEDRINRDFQRRLRKKSFLRRMLERFLCGCYRSNDTFY